MTMWTEKFGMTQIRQIRERFLARSRQYSCALATKKIRAICRFAQNEPIACSVIKSQVQSMETAA